MTQAVLTRAGDSLEVRYTLAGEPSATGTALLVVYVSSADGNTSRQLGLKWLDGAVIAHYVFDFSQNKQDNLPLDANVNGATVAVSFPWSAVSDLGSKWQWWVATNVDGSDVDACPDQTSVLNPTTLTFS